MDKIDQLKLILELGDKSSSAVYIWLIMDFISNTILPTIFVGLMIWVIIRFLKGYR